MITLITGENEYAIKVHVDELIKSFKDLHGVDSIDQRQGENIKTENIPDLFGGVSLFAEERLVIIDNPEQSKPLTEFLAEQIATLPTSANAVLVEPKPDKRLKWFKAVKQGGQVIEKTKLRPFELTKWISQTVKDRGGQIDASTVNYLAQRVGNDQWSLHNEINKLLDFEVNITKQSIDTLVEPTLNETIFNLLDNAVQGKSGRSLELYDELIKRGLDAYQTVTMLGWQLHNMVLVKTNLNTGPSVLASQGGMAPFVVNKTKNLVRRLSLKQIKQIIELILSAEADLKTTGTDAHRRTRLLLLQVAAAAR